MKSLLSHLSTEEIANTITHGFGLVLSIVGALVLVVLAGLRYDATAAWACGIYGISLVLLYGASTLYHSTASLGLKNKLRVADHCGIYLLIAGSYTPFGLIVLKSDLGRNLLIALWTFAIVGILSKLILRDRFTAMSVVSYIVMGWLGVFAMRPLYEAIGLTPVLLVVASGIAYTGGVIFFAWKHFRHHHAIFHIFVLAGSILHYVAVIGWVVPARQ
jgi:hemolysin III